MMKILVLAFAYSICFNLQAQQRIRINFIPSFDIHASIEIQVKPNQSLQITFRQQETRKEEESAFSWVRDTTSIVHVRKLGRYFQQFAFSDTISLAAEQSTGLLKAFTEIYINKDKLSKLKDDRIILDGMTCLITIPVSQQNQYRIAYRPPASTQTQPMDQLIREALAVLRVKSTNPATVIYCMVVAYYL